MTTAKPSTLKSKLMLLLLFTIFLTPVAGSWFLYNFTDIGKDGGAASYGDLILPPHTLKNVDLLDPAGTEKDVQLHNKWSLIYLTNDNCDRTCLENVYRMRQIRLAIGKHYQRVQRVIIVNNLSDQAAVKDVLKDFHGQFVLASDKVDSTFLDAFKLEDNADPFTSGRLYIADPLGNLMMSYSPDQDPTDIIKDMKKIFRVSRI